MDTPSIDYWFRTDDFYIIVLTESIQKNRRLHFAAFSCWVSKKLLFF